MEELLSAINMLFEEFQVPTEPVKSGMMAAVGAKVGKIFDRSDYKAITAPMKEEEFKKAFEKDFARIIDIPGAIGGVNKIPANFTLDEFRKSGTPDNIAFCCMSIKKSYPNIANNKIKNLMLEIIGVFKTIQQRDIGWTVAIRKESLAEAIGGLQQVASKYGVNVEHLYRLTVNWVSYDPKVKNFYTQWEQDMKKGTETTGPTPAAGATGAAKGI